MITGEGVAELAYAEELGKSFGSDGVANGVFGVDGGFEGDISFELEADASARSLFVESDASGGVIEMYEV